MNSDKISASQALSLLAVGKAVELEPDAMDAFQLRWNGVIIPDEMIYYNENLAYVEDFDDYQ